MQSIILTLFLCVRHDIAMLGNSHKIVLGIARSPFYKLISRRVCNLRSYGFRNGITSHDKQLQDDVGRSSPVILKRFVFGLVHVYNRLPRKAVNTTTLKQFQSKLQCIIKYAIDVNPEWETLFHRKC